MPPHQISLKEMWLHFVCSRAKFRAVGQRYEQTITTEWKWIGNSSVPGQTLICCVCSCKVCLTSLAGTYDDAMRADPQANRLKGFSTSFPMPSSFRDLEGKIDWVRNFRSGVRWKPAQPESRRINKHTKKLLFSPHSSEQCCETGLSVVMEKFPFWAVWYHSP